MNDALISAMKTVLGTAFGLYLKTHQFHWNVEGPLFVSLHELFGDQYAEIHAAVDDIAEKIRQLDAYAPGTMERLTQLSRVSSEASVPAARDMLVMLVKDNETMIEVLNEALDAAKNAKQEGIVNFLGGRVEAHAKHRWMLRATAKRMGE